MGKGSGGMEVWRGLTVSVVNLFCSGWMLKSARGAGEQSGFVVM